MWKGDKYLVFVRNWFKEDGTPINLGSEPCQALGYAYNLREAQDWCERWNNKNDPGPLSRKAEFRRVSR